MSVVCDCCHVFKACSCGGIIYHSLNGVNIRGTCEVDGDGALHEKNSDSPVIGVERIRGSVSRLLIWTHLLKGCGFGVEPTRPPLLHHSTQSSALRLGQMQIKLIGWLSCKYMLGNAPKILSRL